MKTTKKVVKKSKTKKVKVVKTGVFSVYSFGKHYTDAKTILLELPNHLHGSLDGGLTPLHFALDEIYKKVGGRGLGRKIKITFELQ